MSEHGETRHQTCYIFLGAQTAAHLFLGRIKMSTPFLFRGRASGDASRIEIEGGGEDGPALGAKGGEVCVRGRADRCGGESIGSGLGGGCAGVCSLVVDVDRVVDIPD